MMRHKGDSPTEQQTSQQARLPLDQGTESEERLKATESNF